MSCRRRNVAMLVQGALTFTFLACMSRGTDWVELSADTSAGTTIQITGVVRHNQIEGGFWAIRGDDSVTYDPTNLPEEFRREGLRVEAEARLRDDMAGIHMAGPLVELRRIRKAP
jgi:hypothetical protein